MDYDESLLRCFVGLLFVWFRLGGRLFVLHDVRDVQVWGSIYTLKRGLMTLD